MRKCFLLVSGRSQVVFKALRPLPPCMARASREPVRDFSVQARGSYLAFLELGLTTTASQKEVKEAYYALAKTCHPDASGKPGNQDKFVKISEAFKTAFEAAGLRTDGGGQQSFRQHVPEAYYRKVREEAEEIVKKAKGSYEVQWNGETISNSGLDRGGHFWYMSMMQGLEGAEGENGEYTPPIEPKASLKDKKGYGTKGPTYSPPRDMRTR